MTASGRPRNTRIDEALLGAFAALVAERGFGGITVDDIVTRAGSNKPAFYRRFRSIADVVPLLLAERYGGASDIDTGSLVGDLVEVQRRQLQLFTDPAVARGLIGWAAHADVDPDSALPFVERFLGPLRAFMGVILHRAAARGEALAGADPEWISDLLTGPLIMRIALPGMPPVTPRLCGQTVHGALDVLGFAGDRALVAEAFAR